MNDVLGGLRSYMSDDPVSSSFRDDFAGWGDSALPLLEKVAKEPHDPYLDPGLMGALARIESDRAMELMVTIIRGETQVSSTLALGLLRLI
ncbi:MAG TPA: hypothetical protein VGA56_15390, partial [Opitutaceae bacterium]